MSSLPNQLRDACEPTRAPLEAFVKSSSIAEQSPWQQAAPRTSSSTSTRCGTSLHASAQRQSSCRGRCYSVGSCEVTVLQAVLEAVQPVLMVKPTVGEMPDQVMLGTERPEASKAP